MLREPAPHLVFEMLCFRAIIFVSRLITAHALADNGDKLKTLFEEMEGSVAGNFTDDAKLVQACNHGTCGWNENCF